MMNEEKAIESSGSRRSEFMGMIDENRNMTLAKVETCTQEDRICQSFHMSLWLKLLLDLFRIS